MTPVSLISHIGARTNNSSKLAAVLMLIGAGLATAQTSPSDIAARMDASIQRQVLSVARMKAAAMKTPVAARNRGTTGDPEANPPDQFFLLPPLAAGPSVSPATQCEPLPASEVDKLVTQAGDASSVPPDLVRSVIKEESGFRPCALSSKGAMGLMQLMGATADDLGVRDAFDPTENVTAGAKLLRQLIDSYNGDLSLALSAYNAGPGRVDPSSGIPEIPETLDYVHRILSAFQASGPAKTQQSKGD